MTRNMRGFTLIEVLLAILIGGLVLSSIYGVFSSVSSVSKRLEKEGEQFHKVRVLFDRIGGELGSLRADRIGQATILSIGTTDAGQPFLEFNTELVSPAYERYGGVTRVRYEVRPDDETETLYREEKLLLVDLEEEDARPFIDGLSNFKVRCFSRGRWRDSWSGQGLPQQIEISFELEADNGSIPFSSSIVLSGVSG